MREDKLYEAITLIDDDLIDETARYVPKKKRAVHWKRWTALAACLVLVVGAAGVGGRVLLSRSGSDSSAGNSSTGTDGSDNGGDGGSAFLSYAGPVFPLTVLEESDGLTACRDVTLDFLPWESAGDSTDVQVTDSYTLTNSTGEDKTVTLLYPFASSLWTVDERRPVLTVGGAELETDLLIGPYSGRFQGVAGADGSSEELYNLDEIRTWEEYRALLEDGSYQEKALADFPDLSGIDAVVYKFTDIWGPERVNVPNLFIQIGFDLDCSATTVLSYGFDRLDQDREEGWMSQSFFAPRSWQYGYGEPRYLIVLGDDVENVKIGEYAVDSWKDKKEFEAFGAAVERYETNLDAALREAVGCLYDNLSWLYGSSAVDFETYYGLFCDHLIAYGTLAEDGGVERYSIGMLSELSEISYVDRVCYLRAKITIPAGGSVTLSAEMAKPASFDYYCAHTENQGVYGYDMVTRLGSTLTFTGQSAALEDRGQIEIVRQNFGFDLERGVRTVELDADTEHYYLEVKRLKQTAVP